VRHARRLQQHRADREVLQELDVRLDVSGEGVGDLDLFAAGELVGERVDFGAAVRGGVLLRVPGALQLLQPLRRRQAGEFVPVVDGVGGGRVGGPVDQGGFRDAVTEDGGDAGDAFAVGVDVVVDLAVSTRRMGAVYFIGFLRSRGGGVVGR
jgi:hypothetical protein